MVIFIRTNSIPINLFSSLPCFKFIVSHRLIGLQTNSIHSSLFSSMSCFRFITSKPEVCRSMFEMPADVSDEWRCTGRYHLSGNNLLALWVQIVMLPTYPWYQVVMGIFSLLQYQVVYVWSSQKKKWSANHVTYQSKLQIEPSIMTANR